MVFRNVLVVVIAAAAMSILIMASLTDTQAQPGTTSTTQPSPPQLVTPSAAAQQILSSILADCTQAGFFDYQCATLVYESPTTVVLNGETLILGGDPRLFESFESPQTSPPFDPESSPIGNYPNPFLWRAVDGFKAQGYTIDSVTVGGVGSQGNPNEFFVIMSKP